jgi:hypothetical protein
MLNNIRALISMALVVTPAEFPEVAFTPYSRTTNDEPPTTGL